MDVTKFKDLVLKEFGVVCENLAKLERAVYGTATSKGLAGGVGEDASAKDILAKYDLLAGLLTKDGFKVKTGCFSNKKTGKAVEDPKVVFLIRVNGSFVEQAEDEAEPLEVKVAKKEELKKRGRSKKEADEE